MVEEVYEAVSETANTLLVGKSRLKVLEAGCGSFSHVRFNAVVYAVGIDISEEQLKRNTVVQEKLLGDIQQYALPQNEFDVVVCWMVLEHLARPRDALLNLFASAQSGGLVILAFPNLLSFKGLVTKLTPLWFHMMFYRCMRYTFRPFRTYLRLAILPSRVIRLAEENGFSLAFCRLLEGGVSKNLRTRMRVIDWAFTAADILTRVITFGKLDSLRLDNCVMILRKKNPVAVCMPDCGC